MADQRFYPAAIPLDIKAITELARGEKKRGCSSLKAHAVAPASEASEGDLCFVLNEAVAKTVADEKGIICLITPDLATVMPSSPALVLTPDPKRAFGLVLRAMYPSEDLVPGISPSAVIDKKAIIADDVRIDAGAVIEADAELGQGVWIKAGARIGKGCIIGAGSIIDVNASIQFAMIGIQTEIGANTVIGGTGFGVGRDGGNILIPHMGRVIIGDRCTIGGGSCIDRGFMEDTIIGDHVMIDNLAQIAHNAKIGNGNVICGQVGIAGSTVIGDNNIFGAQCGVADNVTIGSGNVFAARSGVTKSVSDGHILGGFPAVPIQEFRREIASLRRLANSRNKQK